MISTEHDLYKGEHENLIGTVEYCTFMERPSTIALLHQYVQGDALVKHCLATGAIMKAVAGYFSEDPTRWGEIGILHDIDFEYVKGDMKQPGVMDEQLLETAGIRDNIGEIIRRHNHFLHTGTYHSPVEISPAGRRQRIRPDHCLCPRQRGTSLRCFRKDHNQKGKGEVLCRRV
jgi:predicted hydrolase (HD superfamily)